MADPNCEPGLSTSGVRVRSRHWDCGLDIASSVCRGPFPLRGADRLPNGNTLLTGTTTILEMTDSGQVVWRFVLEGEMYRGRDGPLLGFYKAERVGRL